MSILELFCSVDDFWQTYAPQYAIKRLQDGKAHRHRAKTLAPSEIMTILIRFHQSHYRDFKAFYTQYVCVQLWGEFPRLVSYSRFIQWQPEYLEPLCAYVHSLSGTCSGITFIDSTKLVVCHNARIPQHRVFAGRAARGKSTVGWYYGFQLHLVINDQGQIRSWCLTPGNVDDRRPVPKLVASLRGKLFADTGYLSASLADQLRQQGIQLITKVGKNMLNRLLDLGDKLLLRKRAIIESVTDQLKNISQIEHTRHRSPINFLINLVCGLIAYSHQPHKPSLRLQWNLLSSAS